MTFTSALRDAVSWETELERQRRDLLGHPLHTSLTSPARLRLFAEHHVYCVWDFMSLLKSLQRDLTCVEPMWTPPRHPRAARLINEIVTGEESDEVSPGRYLSHFAWYVEAMDEFGADTQPIRRLVGAVTRDTAPSAALEAPEIPEPARRFTLETLRVIQLPLETRLAVFFFARENVIPGLFLPLVERLADAGLSCKSFLDYLRRHIEVDGGSHGPMARQLLAELLSADPELADQSYREAARALRARRALWDAVHLACRCLP